MKKNGVYLLGVLAVIVFLCVAASQMDKSTPEENRIIVKAAIESISDGDWETFQKLYSEKYMHHGPRDKKPSSREKHELGCRLAKNQYPDLRFEIKDIIAENNKVAVRLHTSLTIKTRLGNGDIESRKAVLKEIDIMRISGGKIVEEWCECDVEEWTNQLGMLRYSKKVR